MEIKIDHDAVATVVQAAIMEQIGPEAREKLIQEALKYLMTEQNSAVRHGFKDPSPLQRAFNTAITGAANTIVREMMDNDPTMRRKLHAMIGEAFVKLEDEQFTYHLGQAIGDSLRKQ